MNKRLSIYSFLFLSPIIFVIIVDLFGYPESLIITFILCLPFSLYGLFRIYRYVKELENYNNKKF